MSTFIGCLLGILIVVVMWLISGVVFTWLVNEVSKIFDWNVHLSIEQGLIVMLFIWFIGGLLNRPHFNG